MAMLNNQRVNKYIYIFEYIYIYITYKTGWWLSPTPLKNMSQLGWFVSQYDGKVIEFHGSKQPTSYNVWGWEFQKTRRSGRPAQSDLPWIPRSFQVEHRNRHLDNGIPDWNSGWVIVFIFTIERYQSCNLSYRSVEIPWWWDMKYCCKTMAKGVL